MCLSLMLECMYYITYLNSIQITFIIPTPYFNANKQSLIIKVLIIYYFTKL